MLQPGALRLAYAAVPPAAGIGGGQGLAGRDWRTRAAMPVKIVATMPTTGRFRPTAYPIVTAVAGTMAARIHADHQYTVATPSTVAVLAAAAHGTRRTRVSTSATVRFHLIGSYGPSPVILCSIGHTVSARRSHGSTSRAIPTRTGRSVKPSAVCEVDEAAVFAHYGLACHVGAGGERQLARR